ncbi:pyridoxine/pyridoxamine 5'-phosphate oxidase [Cellulomonas sp. ICMP 17802]|uniref:pyridoxine/pyridoxamine 5'-phosphate oxidase n=1 Tax=Cellulomonas sp. ICMP 17802 TaxID=3239199 RepID=UPI00351B8A2D
MTLSPEPWSPPVAPDDAPPEHPVWDPIPAAVPVDAADPPEVPDEALALLREWLPANDDPDRPAVTLATVDSSGEPDARTVLLSEHDRSGLYVHTDAASRKVAQLTAHPAVAVVARWDDPLRQLVVRGLAEPADRTETDRAYALRSRYLQQLAWVNTPEVAALPPEERRAAWDAFAAEHPVLEPPESWVGFLVRPTSLTFWTGDPASVSHRREYRLVDGAWTVTELPG